MRAAKKSVEDRVPAALAGNAAGARQWVEERMPERDLNWDANDAVGYQHLTDYHQVLLSGMRAAAKKPINMSKVSEIRQLPDESPGAYLERLLEAYRTYTPFDPSTDENRRMVNSAFVSGATPDIKKKLQKLEGFGGMNMS